MADAPAGGTVTVNHERGVTVTVSSPGSAGLGGLELQDDPLTALTLAPPGDGGTNVAEGDQRPSSESVPAAFWDVMREVIAREVREYVSSTFSENSGFH